MSDDTNGLSLSRRRMLQLTGGSLLALGTSAAGCIDRQAQVQTGDADSFSIIKDPFFIVDKDGEPLGDDFQPDVPNDEELFDPLGEGPPLDTIVDLGVPEYSGGEYEVAGNTFTPEVDAELFLPGLLDSRRLVTRPPEGYDPENPEEAGRWPACTWNDYRSVTASADLTLVDDDGEPVNDAADATGTEFEVTVENGINNALYTFWVVKPGDDGVIGFHPLGDNNGGENVLRVDEGGDGTLTAVNRGGPLNGSPGFGTPPEGESIPADFVNIDRPYFLAAAYHYDDQTWAFYPGPNHMVHFRLDFTPEEEPTGTNA